MINFNEDNLIEEDDSTNDAYDYTNEDPLDDDEEYDDQEEDNDDRYCD